MSSPTSISSIERSPKDSFEALDERLRRWVYAQGWRELREVQTKCAGPLGRRESTVVAAPTSSGKTEAVFLPLLDQLAQEDRRRSLRGEGELGGARILYVSPLKALINDQGRRLDELAECVEIAVTRSHGDVSGSATRDPVGVWLATPETLESLVTRRGGEVARLCANLSWIVIDEVHAFVGSARGAQLASVLARLEYYLGHSVPKVGLSATLGDVGATTAWLSPKDPEAVAVVNVAGDRGRVATKVVTLASEEELVRAVAVELGTGHSLVFANHPAKVESLSQALDVATGRGVSVYGHHGRLGKVEREEAEELIKEGRGAVAVVATSTLELGIDVGELDRVIQAVPEASVGALAQRGGRSGRRGQRGQLTYYAVEDPEDPLGALALGTTTALAQVGAIAEGWVEAPGTVGSRSTLIHQVMAILSERHGASAAALWRQISQAGVFGDVDAAEFAEILRAMGNETLIEEAKRGLVLGELGEREAAHYSFYAVFGGSREWRVVAGTETIGIVNGAYEVGKRFVLSSRAWEVRGVDAGAGVLEVVSAPSGPAAIFGGGSAGEVDYGVRRRQWDLYISKVVPEMAAPSAAAALEVGRAKFFEYGFFESALGEVGGSCVALTFCGDRAIAGALRALAVLKVNGENMSGAIVFADNTPDEVSAAAQAALESGADILGKAASTKMERYDWVLPEGILGELNSLRLVDGDGSREVLRRLARPRR
jgi:ATP-dependent Lhr-like helicase